MNDNEFRFLTFYEALSMRKQTLLDILSHSDLEKVKNNMQGFLLCIFEMRTILVGLMNLDLWMLINVGRFARKFTTLFKSMMEVLILMGLGAGLISILALSQLKLEITGTSGKYTSETIRPTEGGFIGITDESSHKHNPEFEREINLLRSKAISLEFALRKMNSKLRAFNMRDRCKEEDLADFASEAAGGSVLDTPNTESYYEPQHNQLVLFGISLCRPNQFTPRKVIQPWSQAGECWAFRGERGNVKIELAYAAIIEQVTLEHIPVTASLTGKIDSAPRDFRVSAVFPEGSDTIGSFIYNQYGPPSQTFQIIEEKFKEIPVKIVMLEILSNWGNPNYTCIYRFKVHGTISP